MKTQDIKTVAILGRQPALGIAELESLYGSDHILPFGKSSCFLDIDNDGIDFKRLGGSTRIAKILTELPSTNWKNIEKYLIDTSPKHDESINGKLSFGISSFDTRASEREVAKTALLVKKAIKASGQSVRIVPHKTLSLGSATVLYNKLTSKNGWELLVVSDGHKAYLAQTTSIQDIDAYAARDQARPKRDAKVGMLPPKLAQIIINLAVGQVESHQPKIMSRDKEEEHRTRGDRAKIGADASIANSGMHDTASEKHSVQADLNRSPMVLDPFCGTGVLLQEAMLMNYDIYGTDIEPRMVEYTIENLKWLDNLYPDVGDYRRIEIVDATTHKWYEPGSISVVAGETFLGHPLSELPNSEHLSKIIYEANVINHRFLLNIVGQLKPKTRLCLAVPVWRGKHEFLHLPMLDHLTEMGYTRVRFKHAPNDKLIYHRKNQFVSR